MKRFILALVFVVIVSTEPSGMALAQTPVAGDLTAEDLILRVQSDSNWEETLNAFGTVATFEEYQLIAGVPQFDLAPTALALYQKYNAQDVYYYFQRFSEVPAAGDAITTAVQTRVLVFPDKESAAGYLSEAYQAQVESEAAEEVVNAMFAPIDPLYVFENPTVGWTYLEEYLDVDTLQISGHTSGARFVSQLGNIIVSANVSGPWVDRNFDLAQELLNHQADCVQQSTPCEPVTLTELMAPLWTMDQGQPVASGPAGNHVVSRYVFPADEPVRAPQTVENPSTPGAHADPTTMHM